jgi:predicted acetyltransferase
VLDVDYDFAILDLTDDSEESVARRTGWLGAVRRGFRDDRPDDDLVEQWLEVARTDRTTLRGAWLPEGELGAGSMPVATYGSFDKTINAGRELLALRMVIDVTTSPAHRRRGLLRRLIEDDLADAVSRGVPLAALTASEATIYGRWGFGPATFRQGIEVDARPGFRMRSFTDPGRVELLEPAEAWPHVRGVFDRFHARQRGSVEWPAAYTAIHTGRYDFTSGGPDRKVRCALHLDAAGAVDGFCLYKPGSDYSVDVSEMVALDPAAQLGLWSFLAEMDKVVKLTHALAHPHDPLQWALTDLNRVRVTTVEEFLWLRVLDVPRALGARPWAADDRLVLEVDDAQGHAAGRFEIVTDGGVARVARTEAAPDVTLTAETLGSLYLGGVGVLQLHRAGRLAGTDDAVRRWAAMADLSDPPYCLTGF